MAKVSIIVPSYNYGNFLRKTLVNVSEQVFNDWECIIIDDGSLDNTKELIKEFVDTDPRFVYIYQSNAGMSAARNAGLKAAGGEYIQFLDADDLILPEKILEQVKILDKKRDIDIIYGDVRYFADNNEGVFSKSFDMQDSSWMPEVSGKGLNILSELVLRNIFVISAPLIRKSSIDKVGGFNNSLRAFEDWEFWLKCAYNGLYFYFDKNPKCWTLIRVHGASTSQKIANMRYGEMIVRIGLIDKIKEYSLIEANKDRLRYLFKSLLINRIKSRDFYKLAHNIFSASIYWLGTAKGR